MTEQNRSKRIVVGVDGSDQSRAALRWAWQLAGPLGAEIDAVMTCDARPYAYGWPVAGDWDPLPEAEGVLTATIDEVFGDARPAGMRALVREGNPAKALLDTAQGASMLVLGSRGHGGFTGLLLGSVSAHCAAHAKCPVLVVHADPEP
ncbi:MAG: universal stress protein [Actinomycetia bacterium]|nr:universal stress protein [Actinomycetes bacterium]